MKKKKFELKFKNLPNGQKEKAIFIDGEKFEYSVDMERYKEVCKMGPQFRAAAQVDIEEHFAKCLSEFVGHAVTSKDIISAIQTGLI